MGRTVDIARNDSIYDMTYSLREDDVLFVATSILPQ